MARSDKLRWMVPCAAAASYALWCRSGRVSGTHIPDAAIAYAHSDGSDTGSGNVVAVEPYMTPQDYASCESLHAKIAAYFSACRHRGWLGPRTIVVLPEYLGAWLVAAGEKRIVLDARRAASAVALIAASNPLRYAWALARGYGQDRLADAVFRMKASSIACGYHRAMSTLARDYGVTLVGGSLLLPAPSTAGGRLTAGTGPLQNVSPVYLPDGTLAPDVTRKVYPTEAERAFVAPSRIADLPVYETPAGRLGVLICADSWFPECYQALAAKGARIVATPSFITSDLAEPWRGYSGAPAPPDVPRGDYEGAGRITEADAWRRYALAGRGPASGIPFGMRACLRGRLWGIAGSGSAAYVQRGSAVECPPVDGAAILNMWL